MKETKKIFVFTNNPISLNNSNGRSVFNLLKSASDYEIFNFYVHDGNASIDNITYFRISNKDALNIFLGRKKKITFNKALASPISDISSQKKSGNTAKKTSFKLLLRDFIWSRKKTLKMIVEFCHQIKPDILFYQVGDSASFNNIAVTLKESLGVPLIIYDTEDYYFKKWDYVRGRFFKSPIFKLYKKKYDNSFETLISHTDKAVFLTEDLLKIHTQYFGKLNSVCIYNSYSPMPQNVQIVPGQIIYSGNLEVGRIDSIIEISKALSDIDPDLHLTICSQTKNKKIFKRLNELKNVIFLGEISYKENLNLILSSQLILHIESFDPFYIQDTKHAFSTKIPDCLATLNSMLIYAPSTSSIYRYFDKYKCGWYCDNLNDLRKHLKKIVDLSFLNIFKDGALMVKESNHNPDKNSFLMLEVFKEFI